MTERELYDFTEMLAGVKTLWGEREAMDLADFLQPPRPHREVLSRHVTCLAWYSQAAMFQ